MKDASLQVTKALPAAAASNQTGTIPLPVEAGGFSNTWRLGYISVAIPALPNNSDNTKTITLTLQDSADGVTFTDTTPMIQIKIPGVASTGSLASTVKVPLPPNLRGGGIQFTQTVVTGGGTNTASSIVYSWVNE